MAAATGKSSNAGLVPDSRSSSDHDAVNNPSAQGTPCVLFVFIRSQGEFYGNKRHLRNQSLRKQGLRKQGLRKQGRLSAGCCGDAFGNDAHLRRLQGGE